MVKIHEVVRLEEATGLFGDGELIAAALYSTVCRCWYVTDERTTPLCRVADRTTAELHLLVFMEWPR